MPVCYLFFFIYLAAVLAAPSDIFFELHFNHCQICESRYALGILPDLEITVRSVNLRARILKLCENSLILIRQRHTLANYKTLERFLLLSYAQLDLETVSLITGLIVDSTVIKAIQLTGLFSSCGAAATAKRSSYQSYRNYYCEFITLPFLFVKIIAFG